MNHFTVYNHFSFLLYLIIKGSLTIKSVPINTKDIINPAADYCPLVVWQNTHLVSFFI